MGKATDIAIDIAKKAGKKLVLMGPAYHYPYCHEKILPQIDNETIFWLGAVDDETKRRVFRHASAFISTNWEKYHEMFGITNIEALSCGCPVIGLAHKNQPSAMNFNGGEIVSQGKDGFILEYNDYNNEEREKIITAGVELVGRLDTINPEDCVAKFKSKFTEDIMVEQILKYYDIIIQRGKVKNITNEFGN